MPRTLPWEVGPPARKSSTPGSITVKRESPETPFGTASSRASARNSRAPSTSPTPGQPPEEYMREGIDNDDGYVMVEDEFLATAQSFTRHLHKAEYIRRKKLAKLENAAKLENLPQQRPTDPNAPMSTELRKNIESESATAKHKAALDRRKASAGRPLVDSELEDEGQDEDEDMDDDPWVGTSLQPLMVASRQPRSLVGLYGIKSTTRAALGYANATSSQIEKEATGSQEGESGFNIRPETSSHVIIDEDTTSGDDDDLNAQPRPRPKFPASSNVPKTKPAAPRKATSLREPTTNIRKASPVSSKKFISPPALSQHTSSSTTSGRRSLPVPPFKSRAMDSFDEWDEPATRIKTERGKDTVNTRVRASSDSRFKTRNSQEEKKKLKKQRLSEVPTFL